MKRTIEQVENGYTITYEILEDEEGNTSTHTEVVEGEGEDALSRLLVKLGEDFGEPYDKWGSRNIRISFDREGHKWVPPDKT